MPLSEDEQRILDQIAAEFHERDPVLAGELENTTLWSHALRRMKWAGFLFVVGVAILVVALASASSFYVAFGGFVVMLAAALWFERNAAGSAGRAGSTSAQGAVGRASATTSTSSRGACAIASVTRTDARRHRRRRRERGEGRAG